jgi:glycosyltransferase involved in cell wall biosynthesis
MRIALVTDAWQPQLNGVVRTLTTTVEYLRRVGHEVKTITPLDFRTVPCPTYPSIRLAVLPGRGVAALLDACAPDAIHISTEGPLGHAARRYCLRRRLRFTTAFHTQFPEYIQLRAGVPVAWSYAYLRHFHCAATRTMVPTATQRDKLVARGFDNLVLWGRGVDTTIFNPTAPVEWDYPRPIAVYMGRIAVEKNIEAFLDLPGIPSKVVIGDGPDRERLARCYPTCHFLGPRYGRDLARHLAAGDVFVFPSRTDTFGLVLLEALACGLPVAAYPVQGPLDLIVPGVSGVLDEDLGKAVTAALGLSRADCIAQARRHSWAACSRAETSAHPRWTCWGLIPARPATALRIKFAGEFSKVTYTTGTVRATVVAICSAKVVFPTPGEPARRCNPVLRPLSHSSSRRMPVGRPVATAPSRARSSANRTASASTSFTRASPHWRFPVTDSLTVVLIRRVSASSWLTRSGTGALVNNPAASCS